MKFLAVSLSLGLLAWSSSAEAKCDHLLRGIDGAGADRLVAQYKKVIACDTKVANQVFPQFMRAAGDADTLVALSLAAMEYDIWNPVWEMIGKLSSYDARDEVAERVGLSCEYNPKVVGFLQGAYFGLRDIDFSQWDDALVSCKSASFEEWMIQLVEDPPPKLYDEKWSAIVDALVKRRGRDSLPHLAKGAVVAAGNGGPFEAILMQMENAVAPSLGEEMNPEDRNALEESLVGMARELEPDKARSVADRLANSGSDSRAAELLETVYEGRKLGGYYWYGGAAVEAGDCEGEKTAVIHFANIAEPGKRWIIVNDSEEPLRSFKPKLGKCQVDEPWPVLVSPEPFEQKGGASSWIETVLPSWEEKGYAVKTKGEKDIKLP